MGKDSAYVHRLFQRYYAGKEKVGIPIVSEEGKGRCLLCGYLRKLGKRGIGKGKCKSCRQEEVRHQ